MSHHSHINDKSNDEDSTTDFSGFSEFETNSEAIDRERYVNDKFNEILYHVIPTFNQINILFSTVELYSQFVGALEKELHSRSSNKDNPIYHSHVNGKKCVITCRKEQTSVMLSGPGMCAWRETTFLRLSFGLFKAFSAKINNVLSVRYTSTPVENRHRPCTPFPVSPIDFAQSLLDNEQDSTHQPTMSDLNRHLNVLWDISISLQTQIYKFKKLIGSNDFSFQFRKIITRYRRIGYNLNVMRQSACLVFNPITVDNYAAFFNCTPVGRASDSMMAPT